MKVELLIKNASNLVSCNGQGAKPKTKEQMKDIGLVENGAVAIADGKILAVGKTKDIVDKAKITPDTVVIDAANKTVLPGLVDPHTHLVFGGSREHELELKLTGLSYLDILERGGGILSTVRATRSASKEELIRIGLKYADEMLAQGTTTAEAKSGYGLCTADEIKQLKVIKKINQGHAIDLVPTFLGAHALPDEYKGRSDLFVDLVVNEMLPLVKKMELAEFCDVFCEKNVFSVEQTERILLAAREMGFKLKIHADEIESLGCTELAAKVGALTADHLLVVTDYAIQQMAQNEVMGVLLPGTTFNLREKHYAPARKMIEAGVAVALATDFNPGSCPTNNLQLIMTIACLYLEMTPAEVINAVTINAAHALGRGHRIGSLEVGKQADLVIFDAPNYKYLPYRFGTNLVETVIKKGKIVWGREKYVQDY